MGPSPNKTATKKERKGANESGKESLFLEKRKGENIKNKTFL